VRAAVFFGLFYLYVWLVVNPALFCGVSWLTAEVPAFRANRLFLGEFVGYPGGPMEWLGALLCQSYYFAWVGALIVTVTAALLSLATWGYLRNLGGRGPELLHYAPAVLVAMLYGRYSNAMAALLALVVAIGAAWLYAARAAGLRGALRLPGFLLLWGVCYYLAGGAFILFVVMCVVVELARRRWLAAGLEALAAAGLAVAANEFVFWIRPVVGALRLVTYGPSFDPRLMAVLLGLYGVVVLEAVAVWLWARSGRRAEPLGGFGLVPWGLRTVLVVAVAGLALYVVFDPDLKRLYQVGHYSRFRQWEATLRVARRLPRERVPYVAAWGVNRALYFTGRLPYDMFRYPQNPISLLPAYNLWPEFRARYPCWAELAEALYDLGAVNEAEHLCYEALQRLGDQPEIIQRLVILSIAKGRTQAARALLRSLRDDLVYGAWARKYLKLMDKDPELESDPEVVRLRSARPLKDEVGWYGCMGLTRLLLERNPHNRMAFEYRMAQCLLDRDLDAVVDNLARIVDFDYPQLPTLYEEALLTCELAEGKPIVSPRPISEPVRRRAQEFFDELARCLREGRDPVAALAPRYGDSYFFYYVFGKSGMRR